MDTNVLETVLIKTNVCDVKYVTTYTNFTNLVCH